MAKPMHDIERRQRDIGKARQHQHQRAVEQGDRRAAQDLAEQDGGARQRRDQDLAQEAELAVPDRRHRRLHRGVHDVEHDHGREDELEIGVGHDEADLAVDLAAEIGIEADPHDEHPEQRPADAADELAAVADGALHLAQPDGVDAAQLEHDRRGRAACASATLDGRVRHLVCSPPRLPNS